MPATIHRSSTCRYSTYGEIGQAAGTVCNSRSSAPCQPARRSSSRRIDFAIALPLGALVLAVDGGRDESARLAVHRADRRGRSACPVEDRQHEVAPAALGLRRVDLEPVARSRTAPRCGRGRRAGCRTGESSAVRPLKSPFATAASRRPPRATHQSSLRPSIATRLDHALLVQARERLRQRPGSGRA